jgi:hypothetical protein
MLMALLLGKLSTCIKKAAPGWAAIGLTNLCAISGDTYTGTPALACPTSIGLSIRMRTKIAMVGIR